MKPRVFESAASLGSAVADQIVYGIRQANGHPYLLACPSGRSARPVFRALADVIGSNPDLDLREFRVIMLDSYVVESPHGLKLVDSSAHFSAVRFAIDEIVSPINARLPSTQQILESAVLVPDAADPGRFDTYLQELGGVDLSILASGSSDGHVGFNGPGASRDSETRIVRLPESTRRDNLRTYPAFGDVQAVPTMGVTMGIKTLSAARRSILLLIGKEKSNALAKVVGASEYDARWPSSIIVECPSGEIYVDHDADAGMKLIVETSG